LTVIKDCGEQGEGLLSFPKPGISLALDVPMLDRSKEMIHELNEIVLRHSGRIYLTKDGMTTPEDFRKMDDRIDAFLEVKRRWDPDFEFRSAQSARLFGIGG
jgi:decaprenylphospho-beta-D-ribofuranose 2-oxidase